MRQKSISAAEYREIVLGNRNAKKTKLPKRKSKNKYGAQKAIYRGITFDSKGEMNRYIYLKSLESQGKISDLECQPRYEVAPRCIDKSTGKTLPARYYIADFRYRNQEGKTVVEDFKSEATRKNPTYRLKRQIFLSRYGEEIAFREIESPAEKAIS